MKRFIHQSATSCSVKVQSSVVHETIVEGMVDGLLRNRVSARQARERKKAYLSDLETRVNDLEKKNSEHKEKLSTLQNENKMLRQILKNTTASRRGSTNNAE